MSIRAFTACAALALVWLPGCGSSPTAPSTTTQNVAGSWTGTWQFATSGATVTDTIAASITQNGTSATGSWTAASGASGNLTFTVGSTISGTATINQTTITGTACSASTTMAGTASASSLNFSLGALTPSGACQWATSNQFSLTK